jgi:flagellar motor switch protein FliM
MSTEAETAAPENAQPQGVIQQLLKVAESDDGLLPAMQRLAEGAVTAWQTALTQLVHVDVDFKVDRLSVDTARYFLRKALPGGLVSVVHADDWDQPMLFAMPRDLVIATVEALTGSDGSEQQLKIERELTAIEHQLAGLALSRLSAVLEACIANVAAITLSAAEPRDDIDLEAVGLGQCAMVGVLVGAQVASCQSHMIVCMPKAALEMIADSLVAAGTEQPRIDEKWQGKLDREVRRAPVHICALLNGGEMSLGRVSRFKVGDILPLPVTTGDLIEVSCNHVSLMRCKLGQADGLFQLRVDHFINEEQDFFDTLLNGHSAKR